MDMSVEGTRQLHGMVDRPPRRLRLVGSDDDRLVHVDLRVALVALHCEKAYGAAQSPARWFDTAISLVRGFARFPGVTSVWQ